MVSETDSSPEGLLRRAIDANTAAEARLVTSGPSEAGVWADIGLVWTRCADVAMAIGDRIDMTPEEDDYQAMADRVSLLARLVGGMLRVMPDRSFTMLESDGGTDDLLPVITRGENGSITARV